MTGSQVFRKFINKLLPHFTKIKKNIIFAVIRLNPKIYITMSLEKTLVILKPSAVQRGLIGEVTTRFERKGLRLAGIKMMQLTDELLNEHYAHLAGKPFFERVKKSMMASPVIVCCYEGVDAVQVVRSMTGATNGRNATPGTIRGDYSVSGQENIIHTSDSPENAIIELNRFFQPEEIFDYSLNSLPYLYYNEEYQG